MRKWFSAGLVVALCGGLVTAVAGAPAASADTYVLPEFATEVVATVPPYTLVGLKFAPDGRLFVWQKNGVVRVIKNGAMLPTPFIDLSAKVNTVDDRGFWGLAFDPNFATNRYVYMTYTYEEGGNPNDYQPKTSRLVRVTADATNPDVAVPSSEIVILGSVGSPPCSARPAGSDCIPADAGGHVLGTVLFGHDGTLFVGNGDGADAAFDDSRSLRAQDLNSYSGKILRINSDGSAPTDNPFYDGTNSIRSKVWLYGVRNPFRFSQDPTSDKLYFGDVGWNTWEELDIGVKGANYGWPCYEGTGPQPQYQADYPGTCAGLSAAAVTPPYYTYNHNTGSTAIIGGDFYTSTMYPQQFQGNYFFADYTGNVINRLTFDAAGNPTGVQPFATGTASPVSLVTGPDGMIYYLSFTTGQIRRIRYNGLSASATATPSAGPSPLSVTFSSAGTTNPGGGTLTYLWDFGDSTTSTLANPTHTYTTSTVTVYNAKLTVTNTTSGATSIATVKVTVGSTPPTPTITLPGPGTSVMPGQTMQYQGSATDKEDGTLPPSALSWTVLLHHNTHVHNFVGGTGSSGSFVAENHGPIGTFSYEIILTATDSSGLSASTSVSVAVVADPQAPSVPSGLVVSAPSSSQTSLSWTASTDNVSVTGYRVERCSGVGCSTFAQVGTPTTTSFADSGLAGSTSYSYRVRAFDPSNNLSGYSTVASVTTPAGPPPPTGLVAAYAFSEGAGTTVADASGNGNTGTVTNATWATGKFGTALSFNGTNSVVKVPSSASLGLSSGMTLSAWIQPTVNQSGWRTIMQRENEAYFLNASNQNGPLLPSGGATIGSTTPWISGPTPNPVGAWTNVALTYNGATLTLYVNGVVAASQAQTGTIQSVANPLSIGGNSPYGEYFQGLIDEVRVYNRALSQAEIQTDMTTAVSPSAPDTTPPSVPSGLVASAPSSTQATLSWTASTDNVGVTGYRVERCAGSGCSNFAQVGTPTTPSFADSGLVASTSYSYRVLAVDAAANLSGYSSVASVTTPTPDTTPPSVPSGLLVSAPSSTQTSSSWTASTDNVSVAGYQVERCSGASCSTFAQVGTPTTTSFADSGLTPSTSYSYRVRAVDPSGNLSGYSTVASVTTPAGTVPTGLVAAYSFGEGAGTTVADASGNGNTGTVTNATWATGKFGTALSFNGINSVVKVPSSASLGLSSGMTLSAWIQPTASQSGWRTIMQRESEAYFLNASNQTGPLLPAGGGTIGSSTPWITGATPNPVGAWTNVALTYNGSTMTLYVNGVVAASQAQTGVIQSVANPLSIGGNTPYGEYFQGLIDEVRVYNRGLSQAEIQTDMATAVTPPAPDTTPPSTPTNLVATAATPTQASLSWTASTDNVGVTGYRVERCTGTGCSNFAQVGTPTTPTFADSGLVASTSYSYRVLAVDAAGNLSGYSSVASVTTPTPDTTPPSVPSGLVVSAPSSTQTSLSWTASTDNVGVTGYQVERCAGAGCSTFTQVGTPIATSFADSGLTGSTSYSYRVRAFDAAGNLSGYSTVASVTTPAAADTTPPSAPTGLTASASGSTSQISLSWTASTDNVGVTGYRVERCTGASCTTFVEVGTTTSTSFVSLGLTANTTYRFRVRANDAAGNLGAYSAIVAAATAAADTTPPTAPTSLAAGAIQPTELTLTWTASTDNVGVTGYQIERCSGTACTTFAQIGTSTATTYTDSTLSPSSVYRYRVRATDAAGNLSAYSTVVTATTTATPDTTPPSAPSGLTLAAVSTQISLSWTASTDNVGVSGYRVERCAGLSCSTFAQVGTPTTTSFVDTGLTPSTSYSYRVRAADAAGNLSTYSATATAVTTSGLVAAYSFGEGTGTSVGDASGNGNTGTVTSATWVAGKFGTALSFNGSSSVVKVPSSASLGLSSGMTLSAWIQPTANQSGWRTIIQRETDAYFLNASNSNGPLLPSGGGTIGSGTPWISSATPSPVGTWTNVALTYNGATLTLYVNGVVAASQAVTGAIQSVANPLSIGGNTPYGEYFQGLIDEVRVYNRALSQTEIQTDMATAIP